MNYQKLQLHIAQIERAISKFRSKFYDKIKQKSYDDLILLFRAIKDSEYRNFDENQLVISKKALDEVFFGLEHLHYNSTKEIPHEIIFCLEKVLLDWITDQPKFKIVTSLNNKLEEFEIYLETVNQANLLRDNILDLFSIDYDPHLIKINKPKIFLNDFLSTVPLYHELGHFVDQYYQITKNILTYEPKLQYLSTLSDEEFYQTYNHYQEFFADIFAAQYVGNSSNEYLEYISFEETSSFTHPATSKRVELVSSFLSGQHEPEIEYIQKWTPVRAKNREIGIRNLPLSNNPFITDQPVKLQNISEIHTLFPEAWKAWLNEESLIREKYPDPNKACERINCLVKDTIKLNKPTDSSLKMKAFKAEVANIYSTILRNFFQR